MAKMKPDDPAYWMLESEHTTSTDVYDESCSICRDPEYAQMGMPLCFACFKCGGHVPADDCICDKCEADQRDDPKLDHNE